MRIVIDTGSIWHSIRRWFWQELGRIATKTQCVYCGRKLGEDEITHYFCCCERCEGIQMAKWSKS